MNTSTDHNGISFRRELDCRVIMRYHKLLEDEIQQELMQYHKHGKVSQKDIQNHPDYIDTVRGLFPEGNELYPQAGFREKNHIQLCVVNPNAILGYFEPNTNPNKSFKPVW